MDGWMQFGGALVGGLIGWRVVERLCWRLKKEEREKRDRGQMEIEVDE